MEGTFGLPLQRLPSRKAYTLQIESFRCFLRTILLLNRDELGILCKLIKAASKLIEFIIEPRKGTCDAIPDTK
jgi:hypothetical protein